MGKEKKNSTFFRNLRYKYRLVVINDDTFEQRASVKLTKFNLYLAVGGVLLLLVILVTSLIAFTNLKYYLPGVGNIDFRNKITTLSYQTDSLTQELKRRNLWIQNFQNIVSGDIDSTYYPRKDTSINQVKLDSIDLHYLDETDVALREEVENAIAEENLTEKVLEIKDPVSNEIFPNFRMKLKLIAPINGVVLDEFSLENNHLGIDIAGNEDEPIKAIFDGTVILSEWNPKTGYVIGIQHPNNLISFYKHNSLLLKKIGTFVRKGDAIAIIGSSGEHSSGPHLHFELWYNGTVQNPLNFIDLTKLN